MVPAPLPGRMPFLRCDRWFPLADSLHHRLISDQPFGLQAAPRSTFSFANRTGKSKVRRMSLAEVEQQLLQLSEEERRQFATWFFQNQGKILPPPLDDGKDDAGEVSEATRSRMPCTSAGTALLGKSR